MPFNSVKYSFKQFNNAVVLVALLLTFSTNTFSQIEVYVSDGLNNLVKKYDENGNLLGNGNFIKQNSGDLNWPQDIIFLEDQNIVIVSSFFGPLGTGLPGSIKSYSISDGSYVADFSSGYTLDQPTRMAIGNDNLLYVLQWGSTNNKVVRFDLSGNFIDEFSSIGVPQSIGMAWDKNGNLYVSSFGQSTNGYVRKFDSNGIDQGNFINSDILQGPTNIWFDSDDNLLVLDYTLGLVRKFDSEGNVIGGPLINGLSSPEGVAILPNGDFLIGDDGSNSVKRFSTSGNFLGTFVSGIGTPNAVVLRDTSVLSVQQNQYQSHLLMSNVGSNFRINPVLQNSLIKIKVFNTNGMLVNTLDINKNREDTLQTNHLPSGLYFVQGLSIGKNVVQRVIVKH